MANSLDTKPPEQKDHNPIQEDHAKKFNKLAQRRHAPRGDKSKSSKPLSDAESMVGGEDKSKDDANKPESDGLFSHEDAPSASARKLGRFKIGKLSMRKKGAIGGSTVALFLLMIYGFTLVSAPLQFIHIAQSLIPNFSELDEMGNTRGSRLIRDMYRYKTGSFERTRLGIVGNRIADTVQVRLESDGIKITKDKFGVMNGMEVDGKAIHIETTDSSGKKIKNIDFQRAIKAEIKAKGYGKIMTAMMSRAMIYRFGVRLTSLGNLARNTFDTDEDFRKAKIAEMEDSIKNGTYDTKLRTDLEKQIADEKAKSTPDKAKITQLEADLDTFNTAESNVLKGQKELTDGYEARKQSGVPDSTNLNTTKSKFLDMAKSSVGKGSLIVAAVGIGVCMVRGIAGQAMNLEYANRYWPQIRMAWDAIALGFQMMTGQNVNREEVDIVAERLIAVAEDGTTTTWDDAKYMNHTISGELEGVDPPSSIMVGEVENSNWSKASQLIGNIPVVDQVCSAMGNVFVQGGLAVTELVVSAFTGGAWSAAQVVVVEGIQQAFSVFILSPFGDGVVRSLVGDEVAVMAGGAEYGNIIAQGAYFAANESARDAGAFSLDEVELAELNDHMKELNPELQNSNKSFYAKYVDPRSPVSLVGAAVPAVSKIIAGGFAKISNGSILSNLWSSVSSLASTKILAEDGELPYSGVDKIAFSVEEMEGTVKNSKGDIIDVDDGFANEQALLDEYGSHEAIEAEFAHCMSVAPAVTADIEVGYYDADRGACDGEVNQEFFYRYRIFKFDQKILLGLGCQAGDNTSCSELGLADDGSNAPISQGSQTTIVGDPYESSVDVPCAAGTRDLGVHSGYVSGNEVPMRLCALTGFDSTRGSTSESNPSSPYYIDGANGDGIVNSRVSGAWYSLIQAAKAEGVTLSATQTFRTMEHQQYFWDKNPDPAKVAPPGYSSHQAGAAIDFYGMNVYTGGQSCSDGVRATSTSTEWKWLFNNADKYGFKQYSAEAWHWDPLDKSNRCAGAGG